VPGELVGGEPGEQRLGPAGGPCCGAQVPGAAVSFSGRDRLVSEYVESEFLERISRKQRE
jgi:hypothetical protein